MNDDASNLTKEEREKLLVEGTVIARHAWWTAEGEKLSPEEKEKILDDSFARAKAQAANTVPIPLVELETIYKALTKLTKLGQVNLNEYDKMPEAERKLRHEIFRLAEFPSIFARQRLPRESQDKIRAQNAPVL
jgi:hypothetical protein